MAEKDPPTCYKCGHAMERGVIIDRGHLQTSNEPTWSKGAPKVALSWFKTSAIHQHAVVTFRCGRCGYLESYAPPRLPSRAPRD